MGTTLGTTVCVCFLGAFPKVEVGQLNKYWSDTRQNLQDLLKLIHINIL